MYILFLLGDKKGGGCPTVDKDGGGGARRGIRKKVNVITLTLPTVDKDTGGGVARRWIRKSH